MTKTQQKQPASMHLEYMYQFNVKYGFEIFSTQLSMKCLKAWVKVFMNIP